MLTIKNLTAEADQKIVLENVNLEIKKGETHVLLGPNGSGKTSLAQTIMGNPHYQIKSGQILFKDQGITDLTMEERAKLGLALSYQQPPEIKGVSLSKLLDVISQVKADDSASKKTQNQTKILEKFGSKLLERDLNVKFSGGEKKIAEILQILALDPKLVIFDELDSGLDLKNLKKITTIINSEIIKKDVSVLFITHHGQIINGLKPDWTHVMLDKDIICDSQNYQQVISTIRQHGYEKCRQCQSLDS